MTADRLGEIAALGTSVLWALTYVQFTFAVRRFGAVRLNRLRLLIALALLGAAHLVLYRSPFPLHAELWRWGWLGLSGVVGFAVCDTMLFSALLHLGAHRTSLFMALIPLVSALLAWVTFGERLGWLTILGGFTTIGGIATVIGAREDHTGRRFRLRWVGVWFALGAVLAQSLRYILSKKGLTGGFPVASVQVIQILVATVVAWIPAIARGTALGDFALLRDSAGLCPTVGGAVTGPFLGGLLSLVALSMAPVGIASTLIALSPVSLLFLGYWAFGEKITVRAVVGTILAVIGVSILFLS